jgi:hypothetical protein
MLRQRLWLTIVNNETAQQGVERGRYGALLCALLFAILAVDGWRLHQGQGTEGMTIFAVAYLFAAWRIYRGSAVLMEVALIFLPFGVHAALQVPGMQPGGYCSGLAYLFVFGGFELLNGIRGVSYLRAPVGLRRRDGGETPGTLAPNSPLRPRDA